MKPLLATGLLVVLALPGVAFAHASPVEYVPASSATVTEAPEEVRIRFSERAEPGASRIVVTDGAGVEIQIGRAVVDADDPHVLSIPVSAGEDGAYVVTWSVVSSDDGHFTKGGYAYFIGDAASAGGETPAQVEVVQLSALPEATAIAIELLGNSLLLGILALIVFVLRPGREGVRALRIVTYLGCAGVLLALGGAGAHIALKTSELATLQGISIAESFPLYVATVSGSATIVRAAAITLFAALFFLRRRTLLRTFKVTATECALLALLLVFAYFRAAVSHATANPFHPEIGIAVNFLHLLVKDLSAGLLIGLFALMLVKPLRTQMGAFLRRGFRVLAVLLAFVGPTAAYIVWLHLKDPANLSATLWGERFIPLLVSALLSVLLMAYHVIGNRLRPALVQRWLPYTLPGEAVCAVLVVFFSSLMIITSPPLEANHGTQYRAESNGVTITLAQAPFEDGAALLMLESDSRAVVDDPIVLLDADEDGGILANVTERFPGGYTLPLSLIPPGTSHTLSIIASQEGGYDAHAVFAVSHEALAPAAVEGRRDFDVFALVMLVLALGSIGFSLFLFRLASGETWEEISSGAFWKTGVGVVLSLLVGSQVIGAGTYVFGNEFKRECVRDGNAWHLMLPSRDGRPISSLPAEGCMALGGSFHIADAREYRFLKSPGPSRVSFSSDLESVTAGIPTTLEFQVQNEDGTPARLSVQHERLVHVIVISADMTEFFHVHPDDDAPLSAEAIRDAIFQVPFTFPKAGEYIIGVDYASGLSARSEQVRLTVAGAPTQNAQPTVYPLRGSVEGYDISLAPGFPLAGQVATLVWRVQKDGKDVLDLAPYLAAAMHVAIVKDDLSEFVHAHGEVHIPGAPVQPVASTTAHNHAPPPPRFGPMVEAHPVFPSAGAYTVFAQFMHGGEVITAPFSLKVE